MVDDVNLLQILKHALLFSPLHQHVRVVGGGRLERSQVRCEETDLVAAGAPRGDTGAYLGALHLADSGFESVPRDEDAGVGGAELLFARFGQAATWHFGQEEFPGSTYRQPRGKFKPLQFVHLCAWYRPRNPRTLPRTLLPVHTASPRLGCERAVGRLP